MRGMVDLAAATDFLTTHGRVLDRRRLELLLGRGDAGGVLAALAAYRNADGGYGWGLEPDLRVPGSQPAGALHAFEALAEAGGGDAATVAALCDWLDRASLPDGGLPFALPDDLPAGFSGPWRGVDPHASSLHITAAVCEQAHRVPAAAGHPWLERATAFCVAAIRAQDEPGGVLRAEVLARPARRDRRAGRPRATRPAPAALGRPRRRRRHRGRGAAPARLLAAPGPPAARAPRARGDRGRPGPARVRPAATTAAGRSTSSRARPPPRWSGAASSPSRRSRRCAHTDGRVSPRPRAGGRAAPARRAS